MLDARRACSRKSSGEKLVYSARYMRTRSRSASNSKNPASAGFLRMGAPKILVIGSDNDLGRKAIYALEAEYFDVRSMGKTFEEKDLLEEIMRTNPPALVVEGSGQFSRVVPTLKGQNSSKKAGRTRSFLPLIVVSSSLSSTESAAALDAGADDVISGVFEATEFVSRVKAWLRRVAPDNASEVIEYKNIALDPRRHLAFVDGRPMKLALTEFRLLQFFMTHPDFVYGREHLLDVVWGQDRYLDERTVNTYISRLSRKLKGMSADAQFMSVRGVGYQFL